MVATAPYEPKFDGSSRMSAEPVVPEFALADDGRVLPGVLANRALEQLAEAEALRAQAVANLSVADNHEIAAVRGYLSPSRMIAHQTSASKAEADMLARIAAFIGRHPVTAQALADGRITLAYADHLARAELRLRDEYARDEEQLLAACESRDPEELGRFVSQWRWNNNQAASQEDAARSYNNRGVSIQEGFDGSGSVHANLDATGLATVTAALETRPDRTTGPDEPRTLAQRRADRLVGICSETLDTTDPIDTHEPDSDTGTRSDRSHGQDTGDSDDLPGSGYSAGLGDGGYGDGGYGDGGYGDGDPSTSTSTSTDGVDGSRASSGGDLDHDHGGVSDTRGSGDDEPGLNGDGAHFDGCCDDVHTDDSADEPVVERQPVRLSAESAEMLIKLLSGEPIAPTEATTAEICAALGLPTLQDIAMEASSRSTIDVIIDLETLLGRDHPNLDGLVQTLADGRPIPTEVWELLACDTSIRRVVTKGKSQVINYGRATPIISDLLRKLVRKRDLHCQFSGCDIPARYCDIHHLVHWHLGGNTDEQNLACVCRRHHNMIHKLGWTLTRNANGQLITTSP